MRLYFMDPSLEKIGAGKNRRS
uniref:Uncharacterized protein n=1 Tax=Arundo donax TaxID=35708 RepID=A0A0A8Z338_ARUDO